MHTTAIILAGGKGTRMNTDIPKQYIRVDDKPILYYTIKAFEESNVDDIVIVTGDSVIYGESERAYCAQIISEAGFAKVKAYADGGKERYNSVMNGMEKVNPHTDIVLVHDGARPCIEPDYINICINDTVKYGSSVMAVPSKDTIKIADCDGNVVDTPDRNTLWMIQTPQGFMYQELKNAYNKLKNDKTTDLNITDDAMVMENFGTRKPHISRGLYTNIKVTTKEDLKILNFFLKKC